MSMQPDYEIAIDGRPFMTVRNGRLNVDGTDIGTDLPKVAHLIGILSEVLNSALTGQACHEPKPAAVTPQVHVAAASNVRYLNRQPMN